MLLPIFFQEEQHSSKRITNSSSISISQLIERSFNRIIREQCWKKAEIVPGRHPDRWRKDSLGNVLCKRLLGCPGPICYEFDHIVPFSKGGPSSLSNCQIMQTAVNRRKGNSYDEEMRGKFPIIQQLSEFEMDTIEKAIWGNVEKSSFQ